MALRKNITLPSNVAVAYHRVAGIFIHDRERVMEIHLESYRDEATRRETEERPDPRNPEAVVEVAKWSAAASPVVKVDGADFTALFGAGNPEYPTKPDLYAWLKASERSPLVGGVDV